MFIKFLFSFLHLQMTFSLTYKSLFLSLRLSLSLSCVFYCWLLSFCHSNSSFVIPSVTTVNVSFTYRLHLTFSLLAAKQEVTPKRYHYTNLSHNIPSQITAVEVRQTHWKWKSLVPANLVHSCDAAIGAKNCSFC